MKKAFRMAVLLLAVLLFATATVYAADTLMERYRQAAARADANAREAAEQFDVEAFAQRYGLQLDERDEALIRLTVLNCSGAAVEKQTASAGTPSKEAAYYGNRNSKKFHKPTCKSVKTIKESNLVTFASRDEAISQGYTPCKSCNP